MKLNVILPSKEEIEEISKLVYKEQLHNRNNYGYWYDKIKSHCNIVPSKYYTLNYKAWKSIGNLYELKFKLPLDEFYNTPEYKEWQSYIIDLIETDKAYYKPNKLYSFKTGTFSNKFDFSSTIGYIHELPYKILDILFKDTEVEANGSTQIVIRELIDYDKSSVPTIYNGMPLQCEFRVFYDFDNKKVLYTHNYWDYDYCKDYLSLSDKIVFKMTKDYINIMYDKNKDKIIDKVNTDMTNVNMQRYMEYRLYVK